MLTHSTLGCPSLAHALGAEQAANLKAAHDEQQQLLEQVHEKQKQEQRAQQALELENLKAAHAEQARAAAEQEREKREQLQAARDAQAVAARCEQQLQDLAREEQLLEHETAAHGGQPPESRACEGGGQKRDPNKDQLPPAAAAAGEDRASPSASPAHSRGKEEAAKLELVMDVSMRDVPAMAGSNKAFADTLAQDLAAAAAASPDTIEVRKLEPATGWGGVSPATQQLG
jgi:hypothetical protein